MKYLETTNIDENNKLELAVFPNPTTNYINVIFDNITAGNIRLELLNSKGQVVSVPIENTFYDSGVASITISDLELPVGSYFIRLMTASRVEMKGIVITK